MVLLCTTALALCISFIAIVAFVNKCLSKRAMIFFSLIIIMSLSVLAYHTSATDYEVDDLARYFFQMQMYRNYGLKYVFTEGLYKNTPLAAMEMYFFAQIGDFHLLPAFNVAIIWGIYLFLIISSAQVDDNGNISCRNYLITLILVVLMNNIYTMISNVRYPLANALVVLGLFFDYKKDHRFLAMILYILACLIHVNFINVLLIRILCELKIFKNRKSMLLIVISLVYFLGGVILKNTTIPYLQAIYLKINDYGGNATFGMRWYITSIMKFLGMFLITLSCIDDTPYRRYMIVIESFMGVMLFSIDSITTRFLSLVSTSQAVQINETKKDFNLSLIGNGLFVIGILLSLDYQIDLYQRWISLLV